MEETKEHVLVIWAMGSDNRPHMCRESEKEGNRHYIRRATETKKASSDQELRLLSLHAKIPFDDRRAFDSGIKMLTIFPICRLFKNKDSEIIP